MDIECDYGEIVAVLIMYPVATFLLIVVFGGLLQPVMHLAMCTTYCTV